MKMLTDTAAVSVSMVTERSQCKGRGWLKIT